MLREAFHYDLPPELIAQYPESERSGARLLVLDRGEKAVSDRYFRDLPTLLRAGDLLVFNDTRVIPARLHGVKATGGKVEILVERVVGEQEALAHVRASKAPRAGSGILLQDGTVLEAAGREGDLFRLRLQSGTFADLLQRLGSVPLPPYISRAPDRSDLERYQTVYARRPGAVAAPTAGLHFDEPMLALLEEMGIERAFVTLHVGAGTFQPVRADRLQDHRMHREYVEVPESVCAAIERTRARGGRVVAVGTTSVRALETAAAGGSPAPFRGETELFIYPGYRFAAVEALVTNFHLPESSLLMLVCAFGGYEAVMAAYRHAVRGGYRFFSYGDAMFVSIDPAARRERVYGAV